MDWKNIIKRNERTIKIILVVLIIGITIKAFIWQSEKFYLIWRFNQNIITLFIPILLFFLILLLILVVIKRLQFKLGLGSFLAFLGIILAITTFLFNNALTTERDIKEQKRLEEAKLSSFRAVNIYNCKKASETVKKAEDPEYVKEKFELHGYITEIYKDNLGFLLQYFDEEKEDKILKVIAKMDATQGLIRIIQDLNITPTLTLSQQNIRKEGIERYNNQIVDLAKEIRDFLRDINNDFPGVCD